MINYFFIFFLILFNIHSIFSQGCSYDWQCGNAPYTLCKFNKNLPFNKIDIDKLNNRILFTIQYSDEHEKRIISIPIQGTNGYDVKSHNTIYGQDIYQLLYGLSQLVGPKSYDMIVSGGKRIMGYQNYVFYKNNTIGDSLASTTDSNFIFDEDNGIQYSCHSYSNRLTKGPIKTDIFFHQNIYIGCEEMKLSNSILYILYMGKIYKGSLNPTNLGGKSWDLPIAYNNTQKDYIGSFDVLDNILFFSDRNNNLYKTVLNSPNPKKVLLASEPGLLYFKLYNGFIYYAANNKLSRLSLSTLQKDVLFDFSNNSKGHCICAQGFQGQNCQQCDPSSNIISWVNGTPRCIPLSNKSPNNPVVCNYDYQCVNGYQCKELVLSGGTYACQKTTQ